VPSNVTRIADGAFRNNRTVRYIVFEEGSQLTSIERRAFYGTSNLRSIHIPDGVTRLEERTFLGAHNLVDLRLPNGLVYIGYRALQDLHNLRQLELPNTLESIGSRAFQNAFSLNQLTLPHPLVHVGVNAFSGINLSLEWIYYPALPSDSFRQFLSFVYVPYGVTRIAERAFDGAANLQNIIISDSVTRIEARAFQRTRMYDIGFPRGLEYIGVWAFYDTSFVHIWLPESVTHIGARAFNTMPRLRAMHIRATVEYVGAFAFSNNNPSMPIYVQPGAPTHNWHAMWNGAGAQVLQWM